MGGRLGRVEHGDRTWRTRGAWAVACLVRFDRSSILDERMIQTSLPYSGDRDVFLLEPKTGVRVEGSPTLLFCLLPWFLKVKLYLRPNNSCLSANIIIHLKVWRGLSMRKIPKVYEYKKKMPKPHKVSSWYLQQLIQNKINLLGLCLCVKGKNKDSKRLIVRIKSIPNHFFFRFHRYGVSNSSDLNILDITTFPLHNKFITIWLASPCVKWKGKTPILEK